ncbi:hypothetical protein [Halomarina oriensis]|uniref:Uncharacterized protein n=1 Tax=Halomarina oriensis TaxID=671145 RepID=A0A6B0GQV4_9EURY|nr:hypothetical protein [Halomarina oriensis]MWG34048.1 hypothetical protein [Halomarina oriensis]
MEPVSLGVPQPIVDSLPEDGQGTAQDMQRAVQGLEARINREIEESEDAEVVAFVTDVVEHLESRAERYDEFVPELRAWGQSPIYAIAWRNLQADLIGQLFSHEELSQRIDRERNYRIAEDGIRLSDMFKD